MGGLPGTVTVCSFACRISSAWECFQKSGRRVTFPCITEAIVFLVLFLFWPVNVEMKIARFLLFLGYPVKEGLMLMKRRQEK